jgi:hypothetical protein
LLFSTRSNATTEERLRIRDDGLVGINETTLSAQLTVKSGAIDRVGLSVTTTATTGHTATLLSLNSNNAERMRVTAEGQITTRIGINNHLSVNNAYLALPTTGAVISRNIAAIEPALIVNSQLGTGNIQVWQFGGNAVSQISKDGIFVGQSRPTRTDITANATLALADEGKVLRVNPTTAADNITITVPPNGDVAFPVDTEIAIVRYNSGTVTIVAGSGVTINSKNGDNEISGRYGSVALKKVGTDEWVLVGSLE